MFYALAERTRSTRAGMSSSTSSRTSRRSTSVAPGGSCDISAISIHAYAYVLDKYALLSLRRQHGRRVRADGRGHSPATGLPDQRVPTTKSGIGCGARRIAVPGAMTSAYPGAAALYGRMSPRDRCRSTRFSGTLPRGVSDAGLIIHEGQLTYAKEGFVKILDLGDWWRRHTGLPLPLGGNVIRKDIPPAERSVISSILRESILYGLNHRAQAVEHSMPLARGMNIPMADQFIGMYVNDYTLDYGDIGRRAIHEFLSRAHEAGIIPAPVKLEFVQSETGS